MIYEKKITYIKINSIKYECAKCGIVTSFNIKNFISHLDEYHSDLLKEEHSKLITDLSFKISQFNVENERKLEKLHLQKQKEFKKDKIKLLLKRKFEKEKELKEFKKSVFQALENTILNAKLVKQLNSIKTIDVLKNCIMTKFKKEHHTALSTAGIDYIIKKKKRKLKDTKVKINDKVLNSIKPIYTPMGNKR